MTTLLPDLPCPSKKSTGKGVAAEKRALPEHAAPIPYRCARMQGIQQLQGPAAGVQAERTRASTGQATLPLTRGGYLAQPGDVCCRESSSWTSGPCLLHRITEGLRLKASLEVIWSSKDTLSRLPWSTSRKLLNNFQGRRHQNLSGPSVPVLSPAGGCMQQSTTSWAEGTHQAVRAHRDHSVV